MRVPAVLLVFLTAMAGGCAGPPAPIDNVQNAKGARGEVVNLNAAGEFAADADTAVAYDRKLAPEGAQASVSVESSEGQTRTSLVVEGLLPQHHYGAHLHAKPCGDRPDDAGSHYQHHPGRIDPGSEIWLDFTTDTEGAGRASARNDWALERAKLPGSLVIHAQPTTTSGPQAGQAGPRIACLTLA
ncbi:superoxide dismutase family protein [Nonomuraea sp. MG754425]|uniref:superoxide dismutase family protein n=1 Tax=Nonomuraea sp. MG754425 TaxID=2570319 RepID=UPI001F3CD010|nr:superoxide dismutase family protein [Nonomuraea sp. MG754425]MCF6470332.1 superoxide dismutase family protein [Nonomuraea sp. MG754425]